MATDDLRRSYIYRMLRNCKEGVTTPKTVTKFVFPSVIDVGVRRLSGAGVRGRCCCHLKALRAPSAECETNATSKMQVCMVWLVCTSTSRSAFNVLAKLDVRKTRTPHHYALERRKFVSGASMATTFENVMIDAFCAYVQCTFMNE